MVYTPMEESKLKRSRKTVWSDQRLAPIEMASEKENDQMNRGSYLVING
jgi:hypothetical protein